MDCGQDSSQGSKFDDVGILGSLEELSLLNGKLVYIVCWINGLTVGFLHLLKGFVLDLLKLILPESIIVIKEGTC